MQPFNNMLSVGMQAMIINTNQAKNKDLIGKIVTVEALPERGDNIAHYWDVPEGSDIRANYGEQAVIVSGVPRQVEAYTACGENRIKFGFADLAAKHLMPLPPLPDEEFETESEKQLENVE
jgi:hypothetical protein